MQNLWLKKTKLNYSKDVFDIVQFGSSIMVDSSPNDIDIAVIFFNIPIKEQLIQSQLIKEQLQKNSELLIHIKSYDLYFFFDESNFAKENIIFYGKSVIANDYFAKKLGFNPRIQISYSLKNLKKKDKIRFHYLLKGKKGNYGLLKKHGGSLINPGLIEIYPEYESVFIEPIKKLATNFKVKRILF